jgi:hypothetical protein
MTRFDRMALAVPVISLLAAVSVGLAGSGEPQLHNWSAPPFWSPARDPSWQVKEESSSFEKPLALATVPPAYAFVAIAPCRQYNSLGSGGPISSGSTVTIALTGAPCNVPSSAAAVSANFALFTITGASGNGVLKLNPTGSPTATQALINYPPTQSQIDNASVVPLGTAGSIDVGIFQGTGSANLIIDVNGYYTLTGIVNSLNGLNGNVTLAAGTDLSLGSLGQTLTLSANSDTNNTANTLVRRDASGNFAAGTITGNLNGAASLNVLKAGDTMTGTLTINPGSINLVTSPSTATSGSILKNGVPFLTESAGTYNTFLGLNAGNFAMTCVPCQDTGIGYQALFNNSSGDNNTAVGYFALVLNTTGRTNSAFGTGALSVNKAGSNNTAIGQGALDSLDALSNGGGDYNIALGYQAGSSLTTGSNNIYIGHQGAATQSNTIRIGGGGPGPKSATFIDGIRGKTTGANDAIAVLIDSNGQLGTTSSSRRVKQEIEEMGEKTNRLLSLRPVTFRYKPELDATGALQYGLVAEEVVEVFPELVVYDREGQPETLRYHVLPAMLLNEFQKQHRMIQEQRQQLDSLAARVQMLEQMLGSASRSAEQTR